jgi:hypothetical protein
MEYDSTTPSFGLTMPPLPPFRPLSPFSLVAAAMTLGALAPAVAQEAVPTAARTVELPVFTVTETADLPAREPWTYTRIPGFEVISGASDRETRRLVRDFEVFRQALAMAWPVPGREPATGAIVLCGRGNPFPQFIPAGRTPGEIGSASLFLANREQVAIVIDVRDRIELAVGADDIGTGQIPAFEIASNKQLYREYVHFMLSRAETRPPAWLAEGLAQIVMAMEFTESAVIFGRIESVGEQSAGQAAAQAGADAGDELGAEPASGADVIVDRPFNQVLERRRLMPLEEMFAVTHDSPLARNPLGNNRWAKQCYAFVHLCLYGDGKRWQKPFARFVQRAGQQPPTEELFKECFGITYRQMLAELRGYISFTRHDYVRMVLKDGHKLLAPDVVLESAREADIGRVKGDALRLAGHRARGHAEYRAAYIRGERDARLLAALGSAELEAGRTDRARKLLEAAVREPLDRPTPYVELARLRLEEAQTAPKGEGATLSAAQVRGVVELVLRARALRPPLPDTYGLAAAAWTGAANPASREDLRLLDEGMTLFPRFTELFFSAAELNVRAGASEHAAEIAVYGEQVARDPETRARFRALREALPPAPSGTGSAGASKAP